MTLKENQIRDGFWFWDPGSGWPPQAVTQLEDYAPTERLNLNITQLDVSDSEQRKIVQQWCQALPGLTEVRYLWFSSRVNQKMIDAACQMPNLEGLNIKWSGVTSLDGLGSLRKLRHLALGASSRVESISPVGALTRLVTLELEQLNKIQRFDCISNLTSLEGLGINGSMWTPQTIESLKPLESLTNLRYLSLVNSRVLDQTLEPLLHLKRLERFNSSWNFPLQEFIKLEALPKLKYGNIESQWQPPGGSSAS